MSPSGSAGSRLAGYAIVPAHLVAGLLFALLPGSVHQKGWSAVYGAIALLLVVTVVAYGWSLRARRPGLGGVWAQVLLAGLAAALPFFLIDFSDPWHAIVYPLALGASLLACLVVGHVAVLRGR